MLPVRSMDQSTFDRGSATRSSAGSWGRLWSSCETSRLDADATIGEWSLGDGQARRKVV